MEEGDSSSELFELFPFSSVGGAGDDGDLFGEEEREAGTARRRGRREVCAACNRPAENACLCDSFPRKPLRIRGKVVVLQHPNERKRKLATVPLLTKCLDKEYLEVLVGRGNFSLERFPQLAELVRAASDPGPSGCPLLVLYPGQGARSLPKVLTEINWALNQSEPPESAGSVSPDLEQRPRPRYNLLAIDGTWQQAREMFNALKGTALNPRNHHQQQQVYWHRVKLEDANANNRSKASSSSYTGGERKGVLRREPEKGCVTTLEAVAGALGVIEQHLFLLSKEENRHNPTTMEDVEVAILKPLLKMTGFQKTFDPAVRTRLEREEATLFYPTRRTRLLQ